MCVVELGECGVSRSFGKDLWAHQVLVLVVAQTKPQDSRARSRATMNDACMHIDIASIDLIKIDSYGYTLSITNPPSSLSISEHIPSPDIQ